MSLNAFVTLVTTDSYVQGAIVAIRSVLECEGLEPVNPFETVCLVTPATVSVQSIKALRRNFSLVVGVEEIRSGNGRELQLLGGFARAERACVSLARPDYPHSCRYQADKT